MDILEKLKATEYRFADFRDLKQTEIEYMRGMDYYRRRIEALHFTGFSHILDAGCGWGQYSLVLAEKNISVASVDLNRGGLEITQKALELSGKNNVRLYQADLHALPYKDNTFDAVFCYGVLMYTRELQAIHELVRVVKPEGLLYVCSSGPAWPLYKMTYLGLKRGDVRAFLSGVKILFAKILSLISAGNYRPRVSFLRKSELEDYFFHCGSTLLYYGPEGSFGNENQRHFTPLHGKMLFGLPSDFEAVATKRPPVD